MKNVDEFSAELVTLIPQLRAFARMLCHGNIANAEDLVQEALAKALAARDGFQRGTNMRAWTYTILKNQFCSSARRRGRTVVVDPDFANDRLVAAPVAEGNLQLDDLRRALSMLPESQRQALILFSAGGLSYEEAADVLGVAVGTVKSRINRARLALEGILDAGHLAEREARPVNAMGAILAEVETLTSQSAATPSGGGAGEGAPSCAARAMDCAAA